MSSKIGFAVFGHGNMGKVHAKNIIMSGRGTLKWIVAYNLEEAQTFVKTYDLPASCITPDDVQDVYNDPDVDAVVVCSPTSAHQSIIQNALQAEKAVMCEKPVTLDLKTTAECFELARKKKLPLLCSFHRRFDPSFRKVYDKIKSGELGRPKLLKGTSRDHQPPPISYIKTSGGILTDSTVHDLDYSLWLAGSKPERVYVQGMGFDPEIRKYDIDQVLVTIKYKNGVLASIDNGRQASFGYDQRFEVLCNNGQLRVGNRDRDLMTEDGHHVTSAPRIATHYVYRYSEAYENLLHHFIDVLEGKCEMLITEDEVLMTMRMVQACQESLITQNPVIFTDDFNT